MKRLALILAIVTIAFATKAERVSYKDAEKVAKAYYYQTVNAFRATEWDDIDLTCVVNPNDAKAPYNLYVFDVNGDEGYIVVSTDDQIMPVLAYSFESAFNIDNMSPGRAAYLNYYSESNDYAASNVCENAAEMRKQWLDLLSYNPSLRATRDVITSRVLLDGISWTQSWPYNSKCPTQPSNDTHSSWGNQGHAYVGCVATATSMVMKYWNWPATGNGYKTYTWYYGSWTNMHSQNITVNFGNQTYNWYAMPDIAGSSENEELGKLCYHVGVSVNMQYDYDGSGSQTEYVASALKNYFRYSNDVQYVSRDSYSDANWNQLLKSQIDQRYPMVYSGSSTQVGHAWNCDGYQINEGVTKFHMKWGWGTNDGSGFYTLDNLNSTATAGGAENNFVNGQDAVINIHPNQTLPTCQNVTVTGIEGTFDDGSSASDYANNKECYYVINPSCGTYISSLKFPKFDLAEGDYIEVYQGDMNSTELLATYDRDNLPPASGFSMMQIPVTLKFVTDGSNVADGWKVNYSVIFCSTTPLVLDAPSGSFGDGSKSCQYQNNKYCYWTISPAGANSITVSFPEFNVASDEKDYVAFYHDAVTSANRIVKFDSGNLPTQPVTFPYDKVLVKFYTNATEEGDGWLLTYTSSANSIDEIEIMSNLSVVPNPANDDARIAFVLTDASETTITITNMLGQVVGQQDFMLESGSHEISLKNFSNLSLQNQMYFVTLQSKNQIRTCKFLFVE